MKKTYTLLILVALGSAGCLNLKPSTDPTRHFLLPAPTYEPSVTSGSGLAVGLRPVRIPTYLRSDVFAIRVGQQEVRYSDWNRWAEPLEENLLRVLAYQVSKELSTDRIYLKDWSRSDVQYEVELDLGRFEPDAEGLVTLDVRWRMTRPGSREVLRSSSRRWQKRGPNPEEDPAGAVAVMSELWLQLGRELSTLLRGLPG